MNTERNRTNLTAMINHIMTGTLLQGFEKYYAEDCVLCENADSEQTRVGKAANREYETYFVNNAEFHEVKLGPVLADGDHTSYEMYMDLTMGGQRMQRTQIALQKWNEAGQIEKETFYYKA